MTQKEEVSKLAKEIGKYFDAATAKACGKLCGPGTPDRVCCNACASMNGHFDFKGIITDSRYEEMSATNLVLRSRNLDRIPEASEKLRTLQRLYRWDNRTGFLDENGCRLPREVRSVYCQSTLCKHIQQFLNEKDWPGIQAQIQRLKDIRLETKQLI